MYPRKTTISFLDAVRGFIEMASEPFDYYLHAAGSIIQKGPEYTHEELSRHLQLYHSVFASLLIINYSKELGYSEEEVEKAKKMIQYLVEFTAKTFYEHMNVDDISRN